MQMLSREMRVVVFDKRGTGMSDAIFASPTLADRAGDLLAILDASEASCPALFATADAGPPCCQLAVQHPERVQSMVFYASAPRFAQQLPDYPWGFTQAEIAEIEEDIETNWGEGTLASRLMGAAVEIPGVKESFARLQRVSANPTSVRLRLQAFLDLDVRDLLGAVRAPTLVLARPGDQMVPFEAAAAMAAAIPGGQFRALPPGPHSVNDILDLVMAEVIGFVSGKPNASADERVLRTILFTDIVGSTELLSAHGDAHWRHQLDRHDHVVDSLLARYGGRRTNHTGDGIFALFEGPTNTVRCALELVGALALRGIPIRAGVHVGECERRGDEWSGMAVHVGARIAGLAMAGQVLTSHTVRDLCAGRKWPSRIWARITSRACRRTPAFTWP